MPDLRTRLLSLAVLVLAAGVAACESASPRVSAAETGPVAATVLPSATPPEATIAPRDGHANMPELPFSYTLPANVRIKVSQDHSGFYQFRHSVDGDNYDAGLIVRVTAGGRVDPCSETSPVRKIANPEAFIRYFTAIPTVTVADVRDAAIDGHPGKSALLSFGPPTSKCRDVWLWAEEGSFTQNAGRIGLRVTIADVAGRHVAILTIGGPDWVPAADALISSIRFDPLPSAQPS